MIHYAEASAVQGVKGGAKVIFAEFTTFQEAEKLATSGSGYVLAIVAVVMVYAFRTVITAYRNDAKEWQAKTEQYLGNVKDCQHALDKLTNELRELRNDIKGGK